MDADRLISYAGIIASIAGIALAVWFFTVFNGLLDAVHETSIAQVDSAISIFNDSLTIVSATSESVDSLGSFTTNTSATIQYSAEALEGMADATGSFASSLGSLPLVPREAVAPLYDTASQMEEAAGSLEETASSMETASGDVLSAALGIQALEQSIEESMYGMEQTKEQMDSMHATAKTGLVLMTVLVIALFVLTGLSYYRQIRG